MPKRTEIADGIHVVKVMAKKNNATVTIPAEICKELGVEAGRDFLMLTSCGDGLIGFKANSIDRQQVPKDFDVKVYELESLLHTASTEGQRS